jgi:DNA polymerase III delta prime subunit
MPVSDREPLGHIDDAVLPQAEEPSSCASFLKTHARRIVYGAAALALVGALLHLSGSSSSSKTSDSSQPTSRNDTPSPSPSLFTALFSNPLIVQMVMMGLLGAATAVGWKIFYYLYTYHIAIHINIRPSLTITNLDPNFTIVMDYLSKRCLTSMNQRALEAETHKDKPTSNKKAVMSKWFGIQDEKSVPQRFTFLPASSKYSMIGPTAASFRYHPYVPGPSSIDPKTEKRWDQSDPLEQQQQSFEEENNVQPWWAKPITGIMMMFSDQNPKISLTVEEKDSPQGSGEGPRTPTKWLTLSTIGYDTSLMKQIVNDALLWHFETECESRDLKIYVLSENRWLEDWSFAVSCKKRSTDSVVFDDVNGKNILRELIEDARNFFSEHTVKTYADKGMPHRRGYLLYGPPGCGKTSFITVLAAELNKDVCILNLNEKVSDNSLASAMRSAPMTSIIAIEDVDAIFMPSDVDGPKLKDKRRMQSSNLSFSGLLNALDGVASQEGRIIVMTTNHREKLDPALIRPGRVDVEKEIRNASRKQIEGMFLRFYRITQPYPEAPDPETLKDLAKNFAAKLPEYEISMAKLQGFFQAAAKQITNSKGEFIGFSVMPGKCIEKATELMNHGGDQDPSMSVFEHFWRIGLERFAVHFERQLACSVSQFKNCDIDSIAETCVELRLDEIATRTLKKLQKEDEDLMASSHGVADASMIRDLFFAAFPSTDIHGDISVYSRFNSVARVREMSDSPRVGGAGVMRTLSSDETPSASICSRSLLEVGSSVQNLIKSTESRKNTPFLFHTSIFRIKQLFEWYNNKPHACEAMLKEFVKDCEHTVCQFSKRQPSEYLAQELDLPTFLKRLSLPSSIMLVLDDMLIFDVESLIEFCSNSELHVLCARFSLQVAQAKRLLNFCCKDEKKNARCRSMFALPSKQDVRAFFIAYYTSSAMHRDESSLEQHAIEFAEKLCDSVRRCTSIVSYFEIEEYLIDKTPDIARSDEALKGLKSIASATRVEDLFSSVHEHLFRVGLQQYAPAFVDCGATSVSRFRITDVDSVCERCPLLALDSNAQTQIKLLQKEDKTFILEHYASASRIQVKQVLSGIDASDDVVSTLVGCNISLYLLKNVTCALPFFEPKSKKLFDDSVSQLFQSCSAYEKNIKQTSYMDFVRRFNFPLDTFHVFADNNLLSKFVKDIRDGEIKGLSRNFASCLDLQQRSQLDDFCSSKCAVNSNARLHFLYPSTLSLAEVFILFFTLSHANISHEDIKHHAFCFSRILSGCNNKGNMFPFRAMSYFSLNEIKAFLHDKFLAFAENKDQLTIDITVDLCHKLFELRQSDSYFEVPAAPEEPPPPEKSDLRVWLERDVFPGDNRTAENVCMKLYEHALRKMADFECVDELSTEFLQASAKLKFGEAWKVYVAFKALKGVHKQ